MGRSHTRRRKNTRRRWHRIRRAEQARAMPNGSPTRENGWPGGVKTNSQGEAW